MISQRKIEANRRNSQKSTGPRTDEGKDKVKFNALKHGLTAATIVLPHEDAAAYEHRLESWTRELNVPGELGEYLAERAVKISWQLDRADSYERDRLVKQLCDDPRQRDRDRNMAVKALIERLFAMEERPAPTGRPVAPDPSREGPAEVLAQLKATAEGCRRLLAEWTAIKDELDEMIDTDDEISMSLSNLHLIGQGRVLRLLGLSDRYAAIQASVDRRVAALVQLQKLAHEEMCIRILAFGRNEDPDDPEYDLDDPEGKPSPAVIPTAKAAIDPRKLAALTKVLRSTIDAETRRLETLLAELEPGEDHGDGETDEQTAFDDTPEGERLHRYQTCWSRSLLRTLDTLVKLRRDRTADAVESREGSENTDDLTEAPEVVDSVEVAGPPAQQDSVAHPPSHPPIAAAETEPQHGVPLARDASGFVGCSRDFSHKIESAKQSHREDAAWGPDVQEGERNGSARGGRDPGNGVRP
jgi:hypothetical protein